MRLSRRGGPHFGSPDKAPARRLATIAAAGAARVPFTTGILIGIGETRRERIEALLRAARAARAPRPRAGDHHPEFPRQARHADGRIAAEPAFDDHLWTIAVARILFGPAMNIQAPPNLSAGALADLIAAGINDWGGVSPVTPDHVNPERRGRARRARARDGGGGQSAGRAAGDLSGLRARPGALARAPRCVTPVLRASDAEGFAREDRWMPGAAMAPPAEPGVAIACSRSAAHSRSRRRRPGAVGRRDRRAFRRARRGLSRRLPRRRRAPCGDLWRWRELCRHAQHQLHQHLLFPLQVLRVFQGQAEREPARTTV